MDRVYAPVGNWYDNPYVERRNDGFYLVFEGEIETEQCEVSEDFYHAWCVEFGTSTPEEKAAEERAR